MMNKLGYSLAFDEGEWCKMVTASTELLEDEKPMSKYSNYLKELSSRGLILIVYTSAFTAFTVMKGVSDDFDVPSLW